MKSFCKNCESLQPSSFRLEHDAETRKPYEDLCCNTCHFVVATVQGREALAQPPLPAQEPVSFPCCGYTDANAIKWNQFNGVVQCHMCGQVYTVAQPVQELVGYVYSEAGVKHGAIQRDLPNGTPLYAAPPQRERVLFPTMLRKMWSGGEVQAWLDENVNKEKNNGT
jgi:hypothetical protein